LGQIKEQVFGYFQKTVKDGLFPNFNLKKYGQYLSNFADSQYICLLILFLLFRDLVKNNQKVMNEICELFEKSGVMEEEVDVTPCGDDNKIIVESSPKSISYCILFSLLESTKSVNRKRRSGEIEIEQEDEKKKSPRRQSASKSPEQKSASKSPEKKGTSKSPQKKSASKSPEKKSDKKKSLSKPTPPSGTKKVKKEEEREEEEKSRKKKITQKK